MSCFRLLGSTALALTAILSPALADDAATVTLPTLSVTAPPDGSLTVPGVADQKEILYETAGSVGFVDAEALIRRYSSTLRDVLKDSPGVYVQSRYGQELRLSIRGSGIARAFHGRGIEVLQDGISTNQADGSGDFYQIDPQALRSAEVYKGGNGLAYGASTIGGAVNFVTPTARTAFAANLARLSLGSFGTVQASAQVSRVLGDVDVMANLTVTHADGYRDHARSQYEHFNANLGYQPTPDIETRFYVGAYVTDQDLPGGLTLDAALHDPRPATAAAVAGDQARDVRVMRLANRTSFALGDGRLDLDSWVITKELYHPIFQVIDQDGVTYGLAPRYSGAFTVAGLRNDLVLGARIFAGTNKSFRYVNDAGSRGGQTLNARENARNYEAYAENRLFVLPALALVTGVKLLHDERDYEDKGGLLLNPTAKSDDKTYTGLNPKIGLLWQPAEGIQVFADLTRSQDVPDFSDLNQTIGMTSSFVPLSAQKAWTAELGSRGSWGRFAWDATYYYSWLEDELLQFTTGGSIPASTFNAPKTRHQGIELAASADLLRDLMGSGDALTLRQLWNWSDFRFRNDAAYDDNRIPGVPSHVLRTTLSYHHPDGYVFAPSLDWVPRGAWMDYGNTQKVPDYALLGFEAGVPLTDGVLLAVDARNLTDKRYVSDFGPVLTYAPATATFYPGDGRSVFASIRAAF